MQKISILAPVALTEKAPGDSSWRDRVNVHARLRFRFMLKSLLTRFDPAALETLWIVAPDRDRKAIEREIAEVPEARCAFVVQESAFVERCGLNREVLARLTGWQIQQILKLGFARICETAFYLTMDSDIVQVRLAGIADLFPDGRRAVAGVETAGDYQRLYSADFSSQELEAKNRYYEISQYLLGYERPAARAGRFFSETPVVLNQRGVIEMLDHLEARHDGDFVSVLAQCPGWTEYSLYFQFLEMTGAFEEIHACGESNAVLCLDKSVWQPTACYKSQRFYDRLHFANSPLVREGPFAAIQSWIPPEEWLPVRFRGLPDFYRRLEGWLDPAAPPVGDPAPDQRRSLDSLHPAAFLQILEQVDPASHLFRRSREVLESSLETGARVFPETPRGEPKFLTIGMATHNDYDGCYFTIQAIRMYHPEILEDVEFLVIDNDPAGPCAKALYQLRHFATSFRYIPLRSRQGTAVRDLVFREASGEFVLCIDSHVFFPAGALAALIRYCRRNRKTRDLLQGPLISDGFEPLATHFEPVWAEGMYGRWGMDERGKEVAAAPFEIGMQGLGAFACRRESWPGFNPRLSGFGGEEGYLHEKVRRAGGRTLCLPFLRWMHRFERPLGVPYRPDWADRIRNYLLIYDELGMDPKPVIEHFQELVGKGAAAMVRAAQAELAGPFHFFDAIHCINLDRCKNRWRRMQARFRKLGIERAVRRFSAAETPLNHHVGCALSHRRIIAEAKRQQFKTVLVFEDDARFSPDAAEILRLSLQELQGRAWQLLYLGGYRSEESLQSLPGCEHLVIPGWISCTHAIAYHHTVYDAILEAVPDNAVDAALWIRAHRAIDKFYNSKLGATSFLTWPAIATQSSILPEESREFDD